MRYSLFLGLLVACAIALPHRAAAVEVTVGGTRIELAAPKDYCPLDNKHELDSQVLARVQQVLQGHNELLAYFVPCGVLKAWHAGEDVELRDSFDYQVSLRAKDIRTTPSYLAKVCGVIRKQSSDLTKKIDDAAAASFKNLQELAGKVEFGSLKIYGVLREDSTGCYFGEILKSKTDGKVETTFAVVGMTVVKNKMISSYYEGELKDKNTIKRLLAVSRETVAALRARNR